MPTTQSHRPARIWLLIVAVGEYADPTVPALPGVIKDAHRFTDVLHQCTDIPFAETVRLFNASAPRAGVLEALANLVEQAEESDLVVVHIGGHGKSSLGGDSPMPDGMTRYFLPYDATFATATKTGISTRQLADHLGALRATDAVVILDFCFSGGMTGVFWEKLGALELANKNRLVIAAARPYDLAIDTDGGSPMTQYFCEALEAPAQASSPRGWVSANAAYAYAEPRVRGLADSVGLRQQARHHAVGATIYLCVRRREGGALCNVPPPPPNFLPRKDELDQILAAVLGESGLPTGLVGQAREDRNGAGAGLVGMGGIGKSVLAGALARDPRVREAFPDGIVWLTFGRQPEVITLQAALVQCLGHPRPVFADWREGQIALSRLTAELACLVILDDVWEPQHAEGFTTLGAGCRLLITTRNLGVLERIGAQEYQVGVLSHEAAMELLARSAGKPHVPLAAHNVARQCGHLPFALAVVGALVRKGRMAWEEVRDRLERADITELKAKLPYQHDAMLASLAVSVDALPEEECAAFLDCVVFREDALVAEPALLTLWCRRFDSDGTAADVAQELVDRSLIIRETAGETGRRYRLHDLYHDYLQATVLDVPDAHRRLLSCYQARCKDGWPTGPNDGYFFEYLAHHLAGAGRREELRALLLDYEWLAAKLNASGISAVLSDYGCFIGGVS